MKIAAVFVGKPRPSVDFAVENIKLSLGNLSNHNVDSYLVVEKEDADSKLLDLVDHTLIVPALSDDEIENDFKFDGTVEIAKRADYYVKNNLFRQFYKNKLAFNYVVSTDIRYDYILWQRMDLMLDIDPELFFIENRYNVTAQKSGTGELITSDQMAVATPQVMVDAWNYHDIETFNKVADRSFNPEDCLKKLTAQNGVPWGWAEFKRVKLKHHPEERGNG